MRFPDPFKHARHSVALDGFSLHAGVRIHEHDREGLERLCRYAVRPPFALHRLSQGPDGNLLYKMKRARGGSLFLLLTPGRRERSAWLLKAGAPAERHAVACGSAARGRSHLGLPSTGPPVARAMAPEETFDPGPGYDGVDSTWDR